jgi:hypothetical protein
MAIRYSDSEIDAMIRESKQLPEDYRTRLQVRSKRGHSERELDVVGDQGTSFQLIIRQASLNIFDFSLVLAVLPTDSNQLFRVCRYNGRSHEHTNRIEGDTFFDFHIHRATARYQELGGREDGWAQPTTHYTDFETALRCFLSENGFVRMRHDYPELEL